MSEALFYFTIQAGLHKNEVWMEFSMKTI